MTYKYEGSCSGRGCLSWSLLLGCPRMLAVRNFYFVRFVKLSTYFISYPVAFLLFKAIALEFCCYGSVELRECC